MYDLQPQANDYMVVDLETYDPHLTAKNMGTDAHCRRWGGYIFMVQLLHPASGKEEVLPWSPQTADYLRGMFAKGLQWVGANIKYDLNWLLSSEVWFPHHTYNNRFHDVLINAPLLDETQLPSFYSLDSQCRHYKLPTKPIDELMANAAKLGLAVTQRSVRGQLHKLDWDVVADYGLHDVRATWAVFSNQLPLLAEAKLERVAELESKLIPILCMMEAKGVRVDIAAAERLHSDVYKHIEEIKKRLNVANGGTDVSLSPSNSLTQFVLDRGHTLPHTAASSDSRPRYSTSADVLLALAERDPVVGDIVVARRAEKIAKDFCQGAIINSHHNGRIYANINQLVSYDEDSKDSRGVRFGRLSYSCPNLQQVPKRDKIGFDDTGGLGTAMRGLFIAEDGADLLSADFSSQEPRWILHWTETWGIAGASRIGDMYRIDPTISSHDIVAAGFSAPGISSKDKRNAAKWINLGKGYEMGRNKLIAGLIGAGIDPEQADKIMSDYEENFPHVSAGSKAAMSAADRLGYVRTYTGRRLLFNNWEPVVRGAGPALPYDEAYERYVLSSTRRMPIRRAFTYRAFNRIIQGSAADQTKLAMCSLWYDHGILPSMQVHDELVDSNIVDKKTISVYKEVMENVVTLTVPCLTEIKLGPSWSTGSLVA